jgi:hypothetical protein
LHEAAKEEECANKNNITRIKENVNWKQNMFFSLNKAASTKAHTQHTFSLMASERDLGEITNRLLPAGRVFM